MEENKTVADLIAELERNTRRFKAAQIILLVAVLVGVGFLITANYRLTSANQKLSSQNEILLTDQQKQLSSEENLLKALNSNTDSIHQQINCVLTFFNQPPSVRTNTSIAQPNPCIITSSSQGGATGNTKSVAGNATPRTPVNNGGSSATPHAAAPPKASSVAPKNPAPRPLVCKVLLGLIGC